MMLPSCLQQNNSMETSFHCCLAKVTFYYCVFAHTFNYFKGLSLTTRSFVVKIESSQAVSFDTGQQGINRTNEGTKNMHGKFLRSSL